MSAEDFDVVIVGAGAAGLAALRELDRAAQRVLCLEARERIGGRIYTARDIMSPIPIELGAEFVHGRAPEILSIVEAAPLTLYDCHENSIHIRDGQAHKNEDAWLQVNEVMKSLEQAVDEGREQTFAEFLEAASYVAEAKELATSYVEGFNAARAEVIGIQSIVADSRAADEIDGDRSFRLMNGYDAVPSWLIGGVDDLGSKLRLNCVVQKIQWGPGHAVVEFVSGLSGAVESVKTKKVIVTVPLGLLQQEPGAVGAIRFEPEVSDILGAAKQLRFGQVMRVILRFREAVWEEDYGEAGFILSNEKHFPSWWTALPVRTRSITGWSAGPHSDGLLGLPQKEIVKHAIHDLARILNTGEARLSGLLEAVYFHDWHADAFSRGAYSYVPAGAMKARERLAEAVEQTLYFAGEATELKGHSATVHGAIATGLRAARQIIF